MALAGALELQLYADVARIRDDMNKAKSIVTSAAGQMEKAAQGVRNALGAIGLGLSVSAIVNMVKTINDGVDALNDIRDATGSTIEKLSALQDIARRNGTQFDTVTTSLVKFNKILGEATPGSGPELVLKAIGLSAKELRDLDPADALQKTAIALEGYATDGNKARVVQELFGKSIKEVAPYLKDLAEAGRLNATVTTEQAEEAERFNKQLFAMQANADALKRELVNGLIPALGRMLQNYRDIKEMGAMDLILKDAAKDMIGMSTRITGDNGGDINRVIAERAELEKQLASAVKDGRGMHVKTLNEEIFTLNRYLELLRAKQKNEVLAGNKEYADAMSRRMESSKPTIGTLPDASSIKAAASEYDRLVKSINERIEADKLQLQFGRELSEFEKFELKIKADLERNEKGLSAASMGHVKALLAKAKVSADEVEASKLAAAAAKAEAEARRAVWMEALKQVEAYEKTVSSMAESNKHMLEEIELIGLNAEAQQRVLQARNDALILTKQQELAALQLEAAETGFMSRKLIALEEEIRLLRERGGLMGAKAMAEANATAATAAQQSWKQVSDSFVDSLMSAGQSVRGYLINLFRNMVLRPLLQPVGNMMAAGVNSIMGGMADGGAVQGGGMSSLLSGAGSAASLYGGLGAIGTAFTAGSTSVGVMAGSIAGGGGIMGGVASALSAIPVAGWIAAAAVALYSMIDSGGGPKTTSTFNYGAEGTQGEGATLIAQGIQTQYAALANSLGLQATAIENLAIHYSLDPEGDAMTMLDVVGAGYTRGVRMGTTENVARGEEALQAAITEETTRVIFAALKSSDLAEQYTQWLDAVADDASVSEIQAAIDRVVTARTEEMQLEAVLFGLTANGIAQLNRARETEMAALSETSFALYDQIEQARAGLAVDAFTQNSGFFTDAERQDATWRSLVESFQEAGIVLPSTIEAYRELVFAQDQSTAAGRANVTFLTANADAFATLYPLIDQTNRALAVAQERYGLETRLLQLQGNTTELRARELALLDETNRPLQEQIWALEDAAAAEATRAAQAEAARAALQQLSDAWTEVTDSLLEEVRRIRGVITAESAAAQQAQFAILTAQARAGNIDAARLLPGASQSLLSAAASGAATLTDLRLLQAQTAASLEQTSYFTAAIADDPNAQVVRELRAIREENRTARVRQQKHEDNIDNLSGRVTKLAERWEQVGIPTREPS